MKRIIIMAIMVTLTSAVKAQEVYDYLLDKAELVVNNPESSEFDLKVAQFKCTAMRYFRKHIILKQGSVSSTWLDEQAVALNEFVTNYLIELSQNSIAGAETRKKIVMRYCNACMGNPLFKDVDREESELFMYDKNGFTPFCLNTDWVKALAETKEK